MRPRPVLSALLLALAAVPARAESEETWNLMLVDGREAGYVHSVTEPTADGGHVTTVDSLFRMKRLGSEVKVGTTITTHEDAAGRITRIRQVADMAASETVSVGEVRDGELVVTTTVQGKDWKSSIEWPDDVPGPVELERRRRAAGNAPGTSLSFLQFDFTIGEPFELTTTVVGEELVEIAGEERRLLKVVTTSDLLPETVAWLDDDGGEVKTSTSLMGMEITTVPAGAEQVARFLDSGESAEVFLQSTIRANVRLPRPRDLTSVTYRLVPKQAGASRPDLEDERQSIVGRDGDATLLRVELVVPPDDRRQRRPMEQAPAELLEFLEPNAFLQSDDRRLIAMAALGVGDETDAWRAAQKLEALVHDTIEEKSLDVAFATALEVCIDRRGDCSEHAVLLAALCRSAGIPSRVAMGLVYVGGIFGGHAWTEVSIDGEWYALDGTIGRGTADPTHLRFGASSLANGGLSSAMFGIVKGLGAFDLEIVEFAHGDDVVRVAIERATASVVDGVFTDPNERLRFVVPEGWTAKSGATDLLEMSNLHTVARLRSDASAGSILVQAWETGPEWGLERTLAESWGDRVRWSPRAIAGHDGRVGTVRSDAEVIRIGAVRIGETVFSVQAIAPDDAALEAFELVVGTLSRTG